MIVDTTKKILFISFGFLLFSSPILAQSPNDLAKAYYFAAEEAFEAGRYSDANTALDSAIDTLGSSNARLSSLRVKILVAQENYIAAKNEMENFLAFPGTVDALVREMSPYLIEIDNEIEAQREREERERLAREQARIEAAEAARLEKEQREIRYFERAITPQNAIEYLVQYPDGQYREEVINREYWLISNQILIFRPDTDNAITRSTKYEYNNSGQPVREVNGSFTITREYNERGDEISLMMVGNESTRVTLTRHTYKENGSKYKSEWTTEIRFNDGRETQEELPGTTFYNDDGSIRSAMGGRYSYNSYGDVVSIDGAVTFNYEYAYDELGRPIKSTTISEGPFGRSGREIEYQYDSFGNVIEENSCNLDDPDDCFLTQTSWTKVKLTFSEYL